MPAYIDPEASFLFRNINAGKAMRMLSWHSGDPASGRIDLKLPNFFNLLDEIISHSAKYTVSQTGPGGGLSKFPPYDDNRKLTGTLYNLAFVNVELGQTNEAIRLYSEYLDLAKQFGDLYAEANGLKGLGMVYSVDGKSQEALTYYEQALEIYRRTGAIWDEAQALKALADLNERSGHRTRAKAYISKALELEQRWKEGLVKTSNGGKEENSTNRINTQEIEKLRSQLSALKAEYSHMLSIYSPNYFKQSLLRKKIAEMEAALAEMEKQSHRPAGFETK